MGLTSPFLCPQGGAPTPFDRNYGTKLGVKAVLWMSEKLQEVYRKGEPRAEGPVVGWEVGGWWHSAAPAAPGLATRPPARWPWSAVSSSQGACLPTQVTLPA